MILRVLVLQLYNPSFVARLSLGRNEVVARSSGPEVTTLNWIKMTVKEKGTTIVQKSASGGRKQALFWHLCDYSKG